MITRSRSSLKKQMEISSPAGSPMTVTANIVTKRRRPGRPPKNEVSPPKALHFVIKVDGYNPEMGKQPIVLNIGDMANPLLNPAERDQSVYSRIYSDDSDESSSDSEQLQLYEKQAEELSRSINALKKKKEEKLRLKNLKEKASSESRRYVYNVREEINPSACNDNRGLNESTNGEAFKPDIASRTDYEAAELRQETEGSRKSFELSRSDEQFPVKGQTKIDQFFKPRSNYNSTPKRANPCSQLIMNMSKSDPKLACTKFNLTSTPTPSISEGETTIPVNCDVSLSLELDASLTDISNVRSDDIAYVASQDLFESQNETAPQDCDLVHSVCGNGSLNDACCQILKEINVEKECPLRDQSMKLCDEPQNQLIDEEEFLTINNTLVTIGEKSSSFYKSTETEIARGEVSENLDSPQQSLNHASVPKNVYNCQVQENSDDLLDEEHASCEINAVPDNSAEPNPIENSTLNSYNTTEKLCEVVDVYSNLIKVIDKNCIENDSPIEIPAVETCETGQINCDITENDSQNISVETAVIQDESKSEKMCLINQVQFIKNVVQNDDTELFSTEVPSIQNESIFDTNNDQSEYEETEDAEPATITLDEIDVPDDSNVKDESDSDYCFKSVKDIDCGESSSDPEEVDTVINTDSSSSDDENDVVLKTKKADRQISLSSGDSGSSDEELETVAEKIPAEQHKKVTAKKKWIRQWGDESSDSEIDVEREQSQNQAEESINIGLYSSIDESTSEEIVAVQSPPVPSTSQSNHIKKWVRQYGDESSDSEDHEINIPYFKKDSTKALKNRIETVFTTREGDAKSLLKADCQSVKSFHVQADDDSSDSGIRSSSFDWYIEKKVSQKKQKEGDAVQWLITLENHDPSIYKHKVVKKDVVLPRHLKSELKPESHSPPCVGRERRLKKKHKKKAVNNELLEDVSESRGDGRDGDSDTTLVVSEATTETKTMMKCKNLREKIDNSNITRVDMVKDLEKLEAIETIETISSNKKQEEVVALKDLCQPESGEKAEAVSDSDANASVKEMYNKNKQTRTKRKLKADLTSVREENLVAASDLKEAASVADDDVNDVELMINSSRSKICRKKKKKEEFSFIESGKEDRESNVKKEVEKLSKKKNLEASELTKVQEENKQEPKNSIELPLEKEKKCQSIENAPVEDTKKAQRKEKQDSELDSDGESRPKKKKAKKKSKMTNGDSLSKEEFSAQQSKISRREEERAMIEHLPSHFLQDLLKTKPSKRLAEIHVKVEDSMKDEKEKKIRNIQPERDLIPLKAPGAATRFGVIPVDRIGSLAHSANQKAVNFKNNVFFGKRIRRSASDANIVLAKKRAFAVNKNW